MHLRQTADWAPSGKTPLLKAEHHCRLHAGAAAVGMRLDPAGRPDQATPALEERCMEERRPRLAPRGGMAAPVDERSSAAEMRARCSLPAAGGCMPTQLLRARRKLFWPRLGSCMHSSPGFS